MDYIEGNNNKFSVVDDFTLRPPLSRYQELLLLCFHAGQIEPSAWHQHLLEDPALAAYCSPPVLRDPLH